jgi:hypothetical protein
VPDNKQLTLQGKSIKMKPSEMYWVAFALMGCIRAISRIYPELVPPAQAEVTTNEQIAFSFFGLVVYMFCVFATFKMFRSKGVSKPLSLVNGAISIFYWAIIMIIQMIYIFNKKHEIEGAKNES